MYPSPEGWGIIEGVFIGVAASLAVCVFVAFVTWLQGEVK